jgi:hypothetical protein
MLPSVMCMVPCEDERAAAFPLRGLPYRIAADEDRVLEGMLDEVLRSP